ncbi:hypothetical protein GCM10009616_08160 [Microlunatus lacustris]
MINRDITVHPDARFSIGEDLAPDESGIHLDMPQIGGAQALLDKAAELQRHAWKLTTLNVHELIEEAAREYGRGERDLDSLTDYVSQTTAATDREGSANRALVAGAGVLEREAAALTPRHTRFVWVSQPGLQVPPVQGYVLDWRRHSYRWTALVVTVRLEDGGPVVTQEWVDVERLRPVRADPNKRQLGDY